MRPSSNFAKKKKQPNKSNLSGDVRIIGGNWRGRKLKVHDKEGLRPTTDRLKETVFNWLMMDIRGAQVLDCFAGAGSLSFEAASRGAEHITAIEKDRVAAKQLQQNCNLLNAGKQMTVLNGDCFQELPRLSNTFDLVFIDPPFHKNMVEKTFQLLLQHKLIKTGSLVYLEQENNGGYQLTNSQWRDVFELKKEKKAGQVLAQLFEFSEN